jgi:peptidoglycan hydrolase-like protein with peptidoglycan-binding domain
VSQNVLPSMGKCLASLLVLISLLISASAFPDEQTRRIQVELRKRHLFFNNIDGEKNPTLTKALQLYQQRQGLPPTGLVNADTLASLGIVAPGPIVASTPRVAVSNGSEMRGANGERLPNTPRVVANYPEDSDHAVDAIPVGYEVPFRPVFSATAPILDEPASAFADPGDTDPSFAVEFALAPHPTKLRADWNRFVLARYEPDAESVESYTDRAQPPTSSLKRRTSARKAKARRHNEENPVVVAFQRVDRMLRNVFTDKPTQHRRAAAHPARRAL